MKNFHLPRSCHGLMTIINNPRGRSRCPRKRNTRLHIHICGCPNRSWNKSKMIPSEGWSFHPRDKERHRTGDALYLTSIEPITIDEWRLKMKLLTVTAEGARKPNIINYRIVDVDIIFPVYSTYIRVYMCVCSLTYCQCTYIFLTRHIWLTYFSLFD